MRSSLVQGPHRAGKLNILYEEKANVVIFIGASCVCGASYAVPNVIDFSRYDTKCSGETRFISLKIYQNINQTQNHSNYSN